MQLTEPPTTPGPTTPVLELRHASIGYGERPTVQNVDFRLERGEVVALVGPNGSGKTTLVRGILGLAEVMAGELRLFGRPAAGFRERWRIGYVPQRHTVVGAIPSTVTEVVASGRLPRKQFWAPTTRTDRAAVAAAIRTVGLEERSTAPVATLSGGQQRRVLIARALASEPDVLVMDEPTAGVDAESQERLADTLSTLVDDGLTLLVVTHEIAPLRPILSRVVLMRDGRIVADRPADRLDLDASRSAELDPGHDPHHGGAESAADVVDALRLDGPSWVPGDGGRG